MDTLAVLEKVAALPVQTWAYRHAAETRHLGPVAQDFHAAFGLGASDISSATADADGVALAAIHGLNQKVESGQQRTEMEMAELRADIAALRHEPGDLKRLLGALAAKLDGSVR